MKLILCVRQNNYIERLIIKIIMYGHENN